MKVIYEYDITIHSRRSRSRTGNRIIGLNMEQAIRLAEVFNDHKIPFETLETRIEGRYKSQRIVENMTLKEKIV